MKKRINKTYRKLVTALPGFVLVAAFCFVLAPDWAQAAKLNLFVLAGSGDDFEKAFRQGRDLIDQEEWAQAAAKFNEVIAKYPDDKAVDAALYWLAFCYKKQKMFKETDAALDRLLERFPASSWAGDARVMKLEIAAPLGKWVVSGTGGVGGVAVSPGVYTASTGNVRGVTAVKSPTGATTVTPAALATGVFETYGELTAIAAQTPLDREDEIRIAAFQSLLSADPKKGIEALTEILKRDSKASETFKIEVLRVVRRPHLLIAGSGELFTTTATVPSAKSETAPLLREALFKSVRNEPNIKVRKEIIYTLAGLKDTESFDYLARLYDSENDREVKKAIIQGFGSTWGYYGYAVALNGAGGGGENFRPTVVSSSAETQMQGVRFNKLLEIAKTEKDAELRALALSGLQRFAGWSENGQAVETLSKIYDSDASEEFKKSIIQSLGSIKQPAAAKKLMEIAKNDKSDKLRIAAIYALRNINTPEALDFLQDLVK